MKLRDFFFMSSNRSQIIGSLLWLPSLGEDPVKPEHNFDESVGAWLAWGRERGII